MVAFGAMEVMLVAGWQFNLGGTEEVYSDKEVALENPYAGSNSYGGVCCKSSNSCQYPAFGNFAASSRKSGRSVCS